MAKKKEKKMSETISVVHRSCYMQAHKKSEENFPEHPDARAAKP